jgi:hypothetical protein
MLLPFQCHVLKYALTLPLSSLASSVEISSSLAEKQLKTVGEVQSHLSKFTVEHRDATNRPGWGKIFPAIV